MANSVQHISTVEVIAYDEGTKPVQILYNTWAPRPHFIIVQRQPKQDATRDDFQATFEIIGLFLVQNSQFADEAILSIHCGSWYQMHAPKWHVRLCVPEKPYLENAKKHITEIPNNKPWQDARSVEEAMSNWFRKNQINYTKYKNECILKNIPDHTSVESIPLSTFNSTSNEFTLVWLPSTPRIGIVAQSPGHTKLASLYEFMEKTRVDMEKKLSDCDPSFAEFGCHLCLYVHGQLDTVITPRSGRIFKENGEITENPNIVGYIQMDESQYVTWLPHNLRRTWLDEFGRVDHFVRT
ncbi:hypothetical protein I4U23_028853 [Adineta vaga]|nr:hypothetical protein I4U23_028853 [Adineta vaga]